MTVRINKPALNLREEITKAQGVVRYEQRQFWMDGLVENGHFDNDLNGWSDVSSGTGSASFVGGKLLLSSNSNSDRGIIRQAITIEQNKSYVFSITLSNAASSSCEYRIGYNFGSSELLYKISAGNGTYTRTLTNTQAVTVAYIEVHGIYGNGTVEVDNIAIFEIDENEEVIHSLPLGFKPVHVYEDGLIQREGDIHDYTVVKTGGAYAVKPTVQPTATTEICVIAEREL
jgi:hypothetical protein